MKLPKNKKAAMGEIIWWFFYILLTLTAYLLFKGMVGSVLIDKTRTYGTEYVLIQGIIVKELSYLSPNTGILQLGTIDLDKASHDFFSKIAIPKEIDGLGIKLELYYLKNNAPELQKTIFYNEEKYRSGYELRDYTYSLIEKEKYVLVRDKNKIQQGMLKISIAAKKAKWGI